MKKIEMNIKHRIIDYRLCSRCKKLIDIKLFVKKNQILKQCKPCRIKGAIRKRKYKCPHNKIKSQCLECGGSAFCVHKKRKYDCNICKHLIKKKKILYHKYKLNVHVPIKINVINVLLIYYYL